MGLLKAAAYAAMCQKVKGELQQCRSLALSAVSMVNQLLADKAVIEAGVASGDFEQEDLDEITQLTAVWTQELPAGTTVKAAVETFLKTGIGA